MAHLGHNVDLEFMELESQLYDGADSNRDQGVDEGACSIQVADSQR